MEFTIKYFSEGKYGTAKAKTDSKEDALFMMDEILGDGGCDVQILSIKQEGKKGE